MKKTVVFLIHSYSRLFVFTLFLECIAMLFEQHFFLGCAVFSYPKWKGILFESYLPKENYLQCYAKSFHSVEGNSCFYGIPTRETLQRWKEQIPNSFHFVPKIPRDFSHQGMIFSHWNPIHEFVILMRTELSDNLGCFLLQLPPSYSPEYGHDLSRFLNQWRRNIETPVCVELRHPDWFVSPNQERINIMLTKMNISRVILDTRPIFQSEDDPQNTCKNKKPNLPVFFDTTSQICVVRYIAHPNLENNEPYLDEWSRIVIQWLRENKKVYFFVHCPDETYSPNVALAFYKKCKALEPYIRSFPFEKNRLEEQIPLF